MLIVDKRLEEIRHDYGLLCDTIPEYCDSFTFEEYSKMMFLVSSRNFGAVINEEETCVMGPLADLANHSF